MAYQPVTNTQAYERLVNQLAADINAMPVGIVNPAVDLYYESRETKNAYFNGLGAIRRLNRILAMGEDERNRLKQKLGEEARWNSRVVAPNG